MNYLNHYLLEDDASNVRKKCYYYMFKQGFVPL